MDETRRLPVFRAVAATFAFLVERWLSVLRIAAIPTALATGLAYLLTPQILRTLIEMPPPGDTSDPAASAAATQTIVFSGLALIAANAVLNAVVFVGLLKLILRGEDPKAPIYLGFGREELALLGTWGLFFLILLGLGIGGGAVSGALGSLLRTLGPAGVLVSLALSLALYAVMIWTCLRLSLAGTAAVDQGRIGLRGSWTTTNGQLWLLLGYWLVLTLPILIIQTILSAVLAAPPVPDAPTSPPQSPEEVWEFYQYTFKQVLQSFDLSAGPGVGRLILAFAQALVFNSVLAIAGGVAWRMLTDRPRPPASP